MRRARIGIDGNCGFAGLGDLPTAPQNEWVFVEMKEPTCKAGDEAARAALEQLRKNVAPEQITYELDPSHPSYMG